MKIFKNIIINIICIVLLAAFTDFIVFYKFFKNGLGEDGKIKTAWYTYKYTYRNLSLKDVEDDYIFNKNNIYRRVENEDSKLEPILIFSDSLLYGYKAKSGTYSYWLGQITKRPVYNRSFVLTSYQQMLFQLKNEKFYKIIPKPKDIIYSLREHNMTTDVQGVTPWMNLEIDIKADKNGNLVLHIHSIFERLMAFKVLRYCNFKHDDKSLKERDELFLRSMKECKKEVEKHWGKDVNFYIIIAFLDHYKFDHQIKELEKIGFKIIYVDESFKDKKNFLKDDHDHLSEIGNENLAKYTSSIFDKN